MMKRALMVLLFAGCGSSPLMAPFDDGGIIARDSGVHRDGGRDAGQPHVDSGVEVDAGQLVGVDGGVDAGQQQDGAAVNRDGGGWWPDGGTAPDGGWGRCGANGECQLGTVCHIDGTCRHVLDDTFVDIPTTYFERGCPEEFWSDGGCNVPTSRERCPVPPQIVDRLDGGCYMPSLPVAAARANHVYVTAFAISLHPVTQLQWRRCVEAGTCTPPAWDVDITTRDAGVNHPGFYSPATRPFVPVTGVMWEQAQRYCRSIGGRLPTLAEWELAARSTDRRYEPWGNDVPSCDTAYPQWCDDIGTPAYDQTPQPVGQRPRGRSPYGAHDMMVNVGELLYDGPGDGGAGDVNPFTPQSLPVDRCGLATGGAGTVPGWYFAFQVSVGFKQWRLRPSSTSVTLEPDLAHIGFRCVKRDNDFVPALDGGL